MNGKILNFFSKKKDILTPIFLFSLLIIWVFFNASLKETFEYNVDEGLVSMRTVLYLKGFRLYKEIWTDQPPLFPVVLSLWYKLFGASFYYGRILVLIFSAILLLTLYLTIKNLWGRLCAWIACIFLIISISYMRLSISIMIGIPALSLAMVSIYYVTLYAKSQLKYQLILSGVFMSLSLQTKFFTVFLIPIIMLEIFRTRMREKYFNYLSMLLLWLGTVFFAYLTITVIFFYPDFHLFIPQLVKPHFAKLNSSDGHLPVIYDMLFQDYDIALLSLVSIILCIKQKDWRFFIPFFWLLLASAVLFKYRPIWYHYYPLISISACWLAAISFSKFFHPRIFQGWLPKKNTCDILDVLLRWFTAGLIILSIITLPIKYNRMHNSLQGKTLPQEHRIINLLLKYKNNTHWIFSDMPTFAFYADMLIPPEIAVTTVKREFTSDSAGDYFVQILEKYRPEQILLSSYHEYSPKILFYIQKNYSKVYDELLQKAQNYPYSIPDFYISWLWEPLGKYLPKRMQIITDRWFYNLVWHQIRIPIPTMRKISGSVFNKIHIKIFIRKDVLKQI